MNASFRPTILITGAAGLIGTALVHRLVDHFHVVALDQKRPSQTSPPVEFLEFDVTNNESVRRGLDRIRADVGERIASVVHLAAYFDFSGEPSPQYHDVTVRGTERLLKGLVEFQVEQFVFSSTMLVHAPCQPGEAITEDWPLDPKWDYPLSKVETEQLILRERGRIPVVLLRIAGVYDDRCHSIPLANQIQRIYERWATSKVFPGNSSHGQAFVHLDDLVEAIAAAVQRRAQLPADLALLIGERETVSYDELQHRLGRLIHDKEWETREIPKSLAKAGAWVQDALPGEGPFIKPWMIDLADDHFALDTTRALTFLEWQPRRSLRDTLPKMIAALKADPAAWYHEHHLPPPKQKTRAA